MLRNKFILIILIPLFISPASAQDFTEENWAPSKEEQEILMIQDSRDWSKLSVLYDYLNISNPRVVTRALIALANIGDSSSADKINFILANSPDNGTRKIAAFALGQLPCKASADYLMDAFRKEKDYGVLSYIIEALGKTGDENSLNEITAYVADNPAVYGSVAYAIDKFARRNITNKQAVDKLSQIIYFTDSPLIQMYCAGAFAAINKPELLAPAKNDIIYLTSSPDAEVRMKAFSALGGLKDKSNKDLLLTSLRNETDWRVRVNILQAVARMKDSLDLKDESLCNSILDRVDDENENVSLTALQALGRMYESVDASNPVLSKIALKLQWFMIPYRAVESNLIAEAIKTYGRIFKDKVKDELLSFYKSTEGYDMKAAVIDAFAYMNNAMVYKDLREVISADVQKFDDENKIKSGEMIVDKKFNVLFRAFGTTLLSLTPKADTSEYNTLRLIFTEFLGSKDPALVNTCVEALMLPVFEKYRTETAKVILLEIPALELPKDKLVLEILLSASGELKDNEAVPVLEEYLKSKDYEIASTSADALHSITGKSYEDKITAEKLKNDYDWNFLKSINDIEYVQILTNKGYIRVKLYPSAAPFTCINFIKLIQSKFYNHIVFHRVVPNFVIQAGDPTGTGFSGPGYSIRTEISPLKFETGVLGMASSGKDTEGSQFFITQSPQPHLDGKYTIFGKVIDGIDVVNKTQEGDLFWEIAPVIRFNPQKNKD